MKKIWMSGAAALMLTGLTSASAWAADPCDNPQDQTTMNACAGKSLAASDKKLNETYNALVKKVGPAGKSKLLSAQRAWLAWRDAQCAFETMGTDGGSIHAAMYASCADELTQAQTKRLDGQLHCQEGDLSCSK
ncbi:lysozyme inhibitor LprI family protein [Pandoraea sp. PE-S2T-3]|uniref:lysozyme inhibitor LprI family protein n=1 Tax=Pandoraea sp. PE-S2T-3 TaxID=1986993 RepID=UPI000B3FA787|nr:lysozyme inhibitor LprI family protein [Pandoraea sp. PE-S2T-3]